MAGSFDHVDVGLGVDQEKLVVGGAPGQGFHNPLFVQDAVVVDQAAGQQDAGRPERVFGPVVVQGRVVPVPDQLHPPAQAIS